MNIFETCTFSDAVPLYLPLQLYLKPITRLKISLQLPQNSMGKSISNWEVMDKLRHMIKPEEFSTLKVIKTTREMMRLEAELNEKSKIEKIISNLNSKMVKLKDFPEFIKVKVCEAKLDYATRHTWDSFFRDAKNMNEMKAGERPDTVHISYLPIKWFVPYHLSEEDIKPSEKLFYRVFEKFGQINRIDIPICDPYRTKMKSEVSGMQIFDFNEKHFFEGYVQFKEYIGFTKAMDAFKGMKLMHKTDEDYYAVNVKVDFDKSKHLSDASVRRREIVRDRLVKKEIDREEKERFEQEEEKCRIDAERKREIDEKNAKEKRRREREERRKIRILSTLKVKGADELNEKIAKEEKKLLKVQRKLEAIRLVEELFNRIKKKKEKDKEMCCKIRDNQDELMRLKNSSELEVQEQKEKLNRVIEGRVVLRSILSGGPYIHKRSDSSNSSSSSNEKLKKKKNVTDEHRAQFDQNYPTPDTMLNLTPNWYGYAPAPLYSYHQVPPPIYPGRGPSGYYPYSTRGRPSRGFPSHRYLRSNRYRGGYRGGKMSIYPPELQEEYYKYFQKFWHEHDERDKHSYTRSRSRSRCRSSARRRSFSSKRSRSRRYSRNSRSSRSRSYSRNRCRKTSHSRSRSKSRSPSKRYSRSRYSRNQSDKQRRSRSHSSKKSTPHKSPRKSRSCSKERKKSSAKSRSPSYQSIDSSKFISPSRLRRQYLKSRSVSKERK